MSNTKDTELHNKAENNERCCAASAHTSWHNQEDSGISATGKNWFARGRRSYK